MPVTILYNSVSIVVSVGRLKCKSELWMGGVKWASGLSIAFP